MASPLNRGSALRGRRHGKDGKPSLTKDPELLLNDDNAGKPEGIHLTIGRRPYAAFGKCWSTPEPAMVHG
jgi:hypothetical protein